MNKLTTILTVGALAISGLTLGTQAIDAYRGDPSVQGPNYDSDRHAAMEEAFENNDYQAWSELMQGKGRVTQVVTSENFAQFAQAHNLAESGDLEGAQAIRQELGLGLQNGAGLGNGQGQRNGNCTGFNRWNQ